MRLPSCMAALILFLGAALLLSVSAQAGDEPYIAPASALDSDNAMKEEAMANPMPFNYDMYILTLRGKGDRLPGLQNKGWYASPALRALNNTAFADTKYQGYGDRSLSELFGYNDSNKCNNQLNAYAHGEPAWSQELPQDVLKSNFRTALKEGLHTLLNIDPKYNPFLWQQLMDVKLGDYVIGLDARIGSSMYVGPKITWNRKYYGVPFDTELKWVPVLRSTDKDKASYVMFRVNVHL